VIKLNRARQGCASTQRAVLRLSVIGAPGAHHSQLNGESFEKCAIGPIVWQNFLSSCEGCAHPFALFANILAGLLRV
jgi:hypothetical protein